MDVPQTSKSTWLIICVNNRLCLSVTCCKNAMLCQKNTQNFPQIRRLICYSGAIWMVRLQRVNTWHIAHKLQSPLQEIIVPSKLTGVCYWINCVRLWSKTSGKTPSFSTVLNESSLMSHFPCQRPTHPALLLCTVCLPNTNLGPPSSACVAESHLLWKNSQKWFQDWVLPNFPCHWFQKNPFVFSIVISKWKIL